MGKTIKRDIKRAVETAIERAEPEILISWVQAGMVTNTRKLADSVTDMLWDAGYIPDSSFYPEGSRERELYEGRVKDPFGYYIRPMVECWRLK